MCSMVFVVIFRARTDFLFIGSSPISVLNVRDAGILLIVMSTPRSHLRVSSMTIAGGNNLLRVVLHDCSEGCEFASLCACDSRTSRQPHARHLSRSCLAAAPSTMVARAIPFWRPSLRRHFEGVAQCIFCARNSSPRSSTPPSRPRPYEVKEVWWATTTWQP